MRTTVTIDDDLMAKALEAAGTDERSTALREGLKALIQREAARRLIDLGGSVPDAELPPRRRPTLSEQSPTRRAGK